MGHSFAQLNADFTASSTSICAGEAITFTSTSTGSNITTYTWNFGNGETSNQQNPVYTYPNPGTYTVTLAIQNSGGQADAEVKTGFITVNDAPNPLFSVAGNSCTVPINVTFSNTTNPLSGNDYEWNFGNGTNSTAAQPTAVNYTAAGSYTVTLKATNTATGCTKTYTQSLNISDFQADFTTPTQVCAGSSVQFTDNSSAGANVWLWNADVAGTSTTQNPTFVFPTAGTYTISLTSMNNVSGCSATQSKTIQVIDATKPNFSATDTTGCSPVAVNFQNTTGSAGTYTWLFGDGTTFTGTTPPAHTYTGNGSYNVTLILKDGNGCTDSLTKTNYVVVTDIQADFTANPTGGCTPLEVVFSDTSITPSATTSPITSWQWTFGNGQTSTSATPPTQTYTTGKYNVTLTVGTANGCTATITKNEYIQVGTKQQASFTYAPPSECVKTDIKFTNTSTIDPTIDPNEIKWEWDFGGDGNSSDKDPEHQFTTDTGYFDVTLVVDYRGCKDTMEVTDAIYIKAPLSDFHMKDAVFCNPTFPVIAETVDESKLGVASDNIDVYWKWGDGTQTHIPNGDLHDTDKSSTTHQYPNTYGDYTVWQIIYNHTTGCTDSMSAVVSISQITGGFSVVDSVCKLSELSIDGSSATSTHPITDWTYDMGDGGVATGNPATYAYPASGTYTIKQTVTNSVGCSASLNKNPFVVLELPIAAFTATPITSCAPSGITIVNNSSTLGNGAPLASFTWTNTDNGSQSVTTNVSSSPNLVFTNKGTNTVSLVVTDAFGCKSDAVEAHFELSKPTASFTIPPVVCNAMPINAASTSFGSQPLTEEWLVDGQSVGATLTHQFNDVSSALSVTHNIGLVITDANGCKDTTYMPIQVSLPKPDFNFSASAAAINPDGSFTCPPVFMQYKDSTQSIGNVTAWHWDFNDNGNISVNQDPSNTFVFPGTYSTTLTVTDEYGCTGTITKNNILVIRGPKADPSYIQSNDICGQSVVFDLGPNSDVVSIVWTIGNGDQVLDSTHFTYGFIDAGTFYPSVTVKDASNCETVYPLNPITITPNDIVADFTYSPTEIEMGDNVTFTDASTANVAPIVQWTWTFTDGSQTTSTNANIDQTMPIPGYQDVTLTVTDQFGCKAKVTKSIFVKPKIQLPNVFTPNGDGINDYFTLDYNIYKSYDIYILNRWGNIVYSNEQQQGMVIWDGTALGGKQCIDGVYFYKFKGLLFDEKTEVITEGFIHILGVQ